MPVPQTPAVNGIKTTEGVGVSFRNAALSQWGKLVKFAWTKVQSLKETFVLCGLQLQVANLPNQVHNIIYRKGANYNILVVGKLWDRGREKKELWVWIGR